MKEVKAIVTLRNGKELTKPSSKATDLEQEAIDTAPREVVSRQTIEEYKPPPPFPQSLRTKKKVINQAEILEVLRQVNVNIPLLDMIKQVPTYAKFLKDLCTVKKGLNIDKKALGWRISDLKGISPVVCTHHIYLEEEAKLVRQPQRRLNPHMQEVVREEVLKLVQAGIIYPISDSTRVSPTQVVPKKSGITTVYNEKGEEIPSRLTTGWRVCIDYRRLNEVTRKDQITFLFHLWINFLRGFLATPFIVSWMVIQDISKSRSLQRIRKRQLSPVHLAHMHPGGCPLAFVMPLPHSNDVCSAFSAI